MRKNRMKAVKTLSLGILCVLLTGCTSVSFVSQTDALQQQDAAGAIALLAASPVPVSSYTAAVTSTPLPTPSQTPMPSPEPTKTPASVFKSFSSLAPTTTMTFEELVGDNGIYEEPTAYPPPDTYSIIIDIRHQAVLVYARDKQGDYTVPVRYMVCSSGATDTPTPRGTFTSGAHKVRFGKFVNDGVFGQYWTQITGRIYFHSLLYTQRSAGSYTITSYKRLGTRTSHGCVRLLVPDARWIYYHIAPGTKIEIRKGDKDDAETAAIKEKLIRADLPDTRPKLVPGKVPNTDNWDIDTYLDDYPYIVSAEALA